MEGYWEFPGGKVEENEDPRAALAREVEEEIGVEIEVGKIEETLFHRYPDRSVVLLFFQCRIAKGDPTPKIGQSLRWASPSEMRGMEFLPADLPLVERLS
jgi:8-oxo-dGTP diphosphatase